MKPQKKDLTPPAPTKSARPVASTIQVREKMKKCSEWSPVQEMLRYNRGSNLGVRG